MNIVRFTKNNLAVMHTSQVVYLKPGKWGLSKKSVDTSLKYQIILNINSLDFSF